MKTTNKTAEQLRIDAIRAEDAYMTTEVGLDPATGYTDFAAKDAAYEAMQAAWKAYHDAFRDEQVLKMRAMSKGQ